MSVLTAPTAKLRWEDPPTLRRSGPRPAGLDWLAIAAALRARPTRWAIVCVEPDRASAGQTAHRIKIGHIQSFYPAGRFEAKARTVGDECRVYARYIGGES
jgi:hypothetical protein